MQAGLGGEESLLLPTTAFRSNYVGSEVVDICSKTTRMTQPMRWQQPVSPWTKASTKLVFFPFSLFVQQISLYHIGIAQLLAYSRTADSGDVTPPRRQNVLSVDFMKQLTRLFPHCSRLVFFSVGQKKNKQTKKTEHVSHLEDSKLTLRFMLFAYIFFFSFF